MELLWVHWLGAESQYHSGSRVMHLPKVGFAEHMDDNVFGFLDPDLIIQEAHLIPDFNSGCTSRLLPYNSLTATCLPGQNDNWMNFYANM